MKNRTKFSFALAILVSGCARPATREAQVQSGDQFDAFVAAYDRDRDNRLDIHEVAASFSMGHTIEFPRTSDAEIHKIFEEYDLNGDGFVTAKELRQLKEMNKNVRP